MNRLFDAVKKIDKSQLSVLLIFGIVGIVSVIAVAVFQQSLCLFNHVFGIPSPACGMTRAYISLLQLHVEAAFRYHPLFWMPPLLALLAYMKKLTSKIIWSCLILLVLVWIVRMIWLFPQQAEPMVYNPNALIPSLWRWVAAIIS